MGQGACAGGVSLCRVLLHQGLASLSPRARSLRNPALVFPSFERCVKKFWFCRGTVTQLAKALYCKPEDSGPIFPHLSLPLISVHFRSSHSVRPYQNKSKTGPKNIFIKVKHFFFMSPLFLWLFNSPTADSTTRTSRTSATTVIVVTRMRPAWRCTCRHTRSNTPNSTPAACATAPTPRYVNHMKPQPTLLLAYMNSFFFF